MSTYILQVMAKINLRQRENYWESKIHEKRYRKLLVITPNVGYIVSPALVTQEGNKNVMNFPVEII